VQLAAESAASTASNSRALRRATRFRGRCEFRTNLAGFIYTRANARRLAAAAAALSRKCTFRARSERASDVYDAHISRHGRLGARNECGRKGAFAYKRARARLCVRLARINTPAEFLSRLETLRLRRNRARLARPAESSERNPRSRNNERKRNNTSRCDSSNR